VSPGNRIGNISPLSYSKHDEEFLNYRSFYSNNKFQIDGVRLCSQVLIKSLSMVQTIFLQLLQQLMARHLVYFNNSGRSSFNGIAVSNNCYVKIQKLDLVKALKNN